jgi:dihydroflavonol-4-reductase
MTGQRVAVTGATGFLGRHLVLSLVRAGYEVFAVTRRSSNVNFLLQGGIRIHRAGLDEVTQLCSGFRDCLAVFHLASAVDFGGDWPRFHQVNVIGTQNVLAAARSAGVRRVIHCSSIAAIGASRTPRLLNESAGWNLGPMQVPYVTTKHKAEVLALASNNKELEVVVVNPACLIGPDDDSSSEFGTLCRRFWRRRVPIHFGGGNNIVDVRDVATGMIAAIKQGRPGERYILGGVNRSMTAFFSALAHVAGEPIPRWRLPSFLGPAVAFAEARAARKRSRAYLSPAQARLLPWFFYYECSKARNELGFVPRLFHETLCDTFNYWQGRRAA